MRLRLAENWTSVSPCDEAEATRNAAKALKEDEIVHDPGEEKVSWAASEAGPDFFFLFFQSLGDIRSHRAR